MTITALETATVFVDSLCIYLDTVRELPSSSTGFVTIYTTSLYQLFSGGLHRKSATHEQLLQFNKWMGKHLLFFYIHAHIVYNYKQF